MEKTSAELKKMVSQGRINEVIDYMLITLKKTRFYDDIVVISSRFEKYNESVRRGHTSKQDLDIALNNITSSILSLIDKSGEKKVENRPWLFAIAFILMAGLAVFFYFDRKGNKDEDPATQSALAFPDPSRFIKLNTSDFVYSEDSAMVAKNNSALKILTDSRTIDLTNVFKSNEIKWYRNIKLKKESPVDYLILDYLAGEIKFDTTTDRIKKIEGYMRKNKYGVLRKTYRVYIDVSKEEIGKEFFRDLHTIYENQFTNRPWIEMKLYSDVEKVTLKILFNPMNSPTTMKTTYSHRVGGKMQYDDYLNPLINRSPLLDVETPTEVVTWEIESPKYPNVYRIEWQWPKK